MTTKELEEANLLHIRIIELEIIINHLNDNGVVVLFSNDKSKGFLHVTNFVKEMILKGLKDNMTELEQKFNNIN